MRALLALTLMCSAALAQAQVVTRDIPYQDDEGDGRQAPGHRRGA